MQNKRSFSMLVGSLISIASVTGATSYALELNTHETVLNNGLKVIVKEDHRSPVIISQIWYRVGSSYEANGYTGLSHMLEHMMFKATKNLKDGEFTDIIAQKGGQQNAFTSNDYTGYYQMLGNQHLETSFQLESERMQNLLLDPAVFSKEQQVVAEERRMRTEDDPISNTHERLMAAAYISSPYHHPVIGWPDDIQNYDVKDLRSWYESWYAPNNAIIVVVGDVKPEEVFASAWKYFGNIKSKQLPVIKSRKEMKPLGERSLTIKLPAKLPVLFMAYNVPSYKTIANKKESYTLEVISSILTSGNSSRITKQLERQQELVISASSSYDSFNLYDGLF
ncbi:MAG: insulinase family protein, partial [Gammaproteobacteria bacterium]|nr:insulinase family protein [Gammaproteobacteria bacterium]